MTAIRKTQASGYRAAALKAVFAACRAHGIDEDMRHDIVRTITGKASLKDCTEAEMGKVLDRLNGKNPPLPRPLSREGRGESGEWRFVFRAAPSRQPYLKKIYRLSETIGKAQTPPVPVMPKHYIEGVAEQMVGCETRLEWCDEALLIKIISALDTHIRRSGRSTLRPY